MDMDMVYLPRGKAEAVAKQNRNKKKHTICCIRLICDNYVRNWKVWLCMIKQANAPGDLIFLANTHLYFISIKLFIAIVGVLCSGCALWTLQFDAVFVDDNDDDEEREKNCSVGMKALCSLKLFACFFFATRCTLHTLFSAITVTYVLMYCIHITSKVL